MGKKKVKNLGLKSLPSGLDPKAKGIQCEGMYDPYWILENYKPNPENYKKHSKAQRDTLFEAITEYGWMKPLVINLTTGYFIDGHGRVEMAAERGIPAKIGWAYADRGEEAMIMAILDSIGLMSETDPDAHKQLIKRGYDSLKKGTSTSNLQRTMAALDERAKRIKEGKEKRIAMTQSRKKRIQAAREDTASRKISNASKDTVGESLYDKTLKDHVRFKSTNMIGIPDIKESMQYGRTKEELNNLPTEAWLGAKEELEHNHYVCYSNRTSLDYHKNEGDPYAFMGFYTEDYRFEHLYVKASEFMPRLKEWKFKAVFEPDFSMYTDWSVAENMWNLFRARWCNRYMQELGIKTIPRILPAAQVNFRQNTLSGMGVDPYWPYEFALTSLPEKTQVVCMNARQQHQNGKEIVVEGVKLAIIRAVGYLPNLKAIILYGGLDVQKYVSDVVPDKLKVIYMDPHINRRRREAKMRKSKNRGLHGTVRQD